MLVSLVMLGWLHLSECITFIATPTTLVSKEFTNIWTTSQPQTFGPENHLKRGPFIKTTCLRAMSLAFHPAHSSSRN